MYKLRVKVLVCLFELTVYEYRGKIATLFDKIPYMRNRWPFILKLFFSLVLLGVVLFFIDLREIGKIILNANPWYVIAVIALIFVDRALMAYKWNLLLQAVNIQIPFFHVFRIYTIAPLSGILLPSTVGGDLFRLYSLSRYKADNKTVLASIVVERIIGFVAVLLFAIFSLGLASYLLRGKGVPFATIWWFLFAGAVIVAAVLGMLHPGFRQFVDGLVARFRMYPLVSKLHSVYALCSDYRKHLPIVGIVVFWTFVEQMAPIIGNFVMARALHIDVSFVDMVAILPLIVLATRLPVSLDGLGVQEGLYVALFGLVGVSPSEAFSLSAMGRLIPFICALPLGIDYIMRGHQTILPERPAKV